MLGEPNWSSMSGITGENGLATITLLAYIFYSFMAALVLMNLLIAMMADTYNGRTHNPYPSPDPISNPTHRHDGRHLQR